MGKFDHIVIAVALDHEALVPAKLEMARGLLAPGGRITLLTVLEDVPGFVAEFVEMRDANHLTTKVRDKVASFAGDAPDVSVAVAKGKAGVQIVGHAEREGADLIIVGSHAPSARDYFLGSTAARVTRRAHCSVFIIRE
ncbi:universal stress protein [Litorisediminicola beolgyonensis]|uniref:Universal stress protein n=1 Tax=Litorisediminicola beolgyonensis TaxID=1173614 RepID=A0ABW3ZL66_9RHOB